MKQTFHPMLPIVALTAACISFSVTQNLFGNNAAADATAAAPAQVVSNRTLPKVDPPQSGLRFSDQPTEREFLRVRLFREALVPIGGQPTLEENQMFAAALQKYAVRTNSEDYSALTAFTRKHPLSAWNPSLLTALGFEFYHAAYYSRAIEAWRQAWEMARDARDNNGRAIADRAVGELATLYAKLGRMTELDRLFKSIEGRTVIGPGAERISGAKQGFWNMQNRPDISFRCGPLALHRIKAAQESRKEDVDALMKSDSTTNGFSLVQVADLSRQFGLDYQMAYRQKAGDIIVPSVVHWKLDHYAAIIRKQGDHYLVQDPTFKNDVWVTKAALDQEGSGFYLVPSGTLPRGWRSVSADEGARVWGKGFTGENEDGVNACDMSTESEGCSDGSSCEGMAVPSIFLQAVSLNLKDQPLGYTPPVGPAAKLMLRYNQREIQQPGVFSFSNFGPLWTCDWIGYIPPPRFSGGGGGFLGGVGRSGGGGGSGGGSVSAPNAIHYSPAASGGLSHHRDNQSQMTRTPERGIKVTFGDGSKIVHDPLNVGDPSAPDGTFDTVSGSETVLDIVNDNDTRAKYLREITDPSGNKLSFGYDQDLRLATVTDAIGQVTTIHYEHATDYFKITKVTDPFGRFATFDYDSQGRLIKITDVIGLTSQFAYEGDSHFINTLTTPYGVTTFTKDEVGTYRAVEINYPNGDKERVEFNQQVTIYNNDPKTPQGMATVNDYLEFRNTYWWDRKATAEAYGDYRKARVYHWLHSADGGSTVKIPESVKKPLENRVWYNYDGQSTAHFVGANNRPTKIGRVLDDGTTQLYQIGYNAFGNITNYIDPVGRKMSYLYSTNGIDLLEVRQTRADNNELLGQITWNDKHNPLTYTDAAGQVTKFGYNSRGQLTHLTNALGHVVEFNYNLFGYLTSIDGPLPGTNDMVRFTYDAFGRPRTHTDTSGYTVTVDYDPMNRPTRITYPNGTYDEFGYNRLDMVTYRDRMGRVTTMEYDNLRRLNKWTDPLNRSTLLEWCTCGRPESLTDAMGRTTTWINDLQGRNVAKVYGDGSRVTYDYEKTISRLKQVTDERGQTTKYSYNADNSLRSRSHPNAEIPTPSVSLTYDPNYRRVTKVTDGIGDTIYSYNPPGQLGALRHASLDGPWPNDNVIYFYDALGRVTNGVVANINQIWAYDSLNRATNIINPLGNFQFAYEGASFRVADETYPNGQTTHLDYFGNSGDQLLQRITHRKPDNSLISRFEYSHNTIENITNWTQELGVLNESWSIGYDASDRLASVIIDQDGTNTIQRNYEYDALDNRVIEQVNSVTNTSAHNALNQLVTATGVASTNVTYEWDGLNQLTAIVEGPSRIEFSYDPRSRWRTIVVSSNSVVLSERRFIWAGRNLREVRDGNDNVIQRYYNLGEERSGTNLYYLRDHLGSVRNITDSSATVRATFAYDPYGQRSQLAGDLNGDFGFTGLFSESSLSLAHFRAYHPALGRWLSRDPLGAAEFLAGPNLYSYVRGNPVNYTDPEGLMDSVTSTCARNPALCEEIIIAGGGAAGAAGGAGRGGGGAAASAASSCVNAFANTFVPLIRSGADKVSVNIRLPDGLIYVVGNRASTLGAKAAQDLTEARMWAARWWGAMVQESAAWRDTLTSEENQRYLRWLAEKADKMFGL